MAVKTLLKRFLLCVFPNSLLAQMAFEVRSSFRFISQGRRTSRKLRTLTGVRVNIGCGLQPTEGWINLDMVADPRIDYWDCRRGLPFRDGAVSAIFTEHFLEHLEYPGEASRFLEECCRCLSRDGVLRIIVPDAGHYLGLYANDDWQGMVASRPLVPSGAGYVDRWLGDSYTTRMEFVNAVFRQKGEHKYAYDAETLAAALGRAVFSTIRRVEFGVSADPLMARDTAERRAESLYIEASKSQCSEPQPLSEALLFTR